MPFVANAETIARQAMQEVAPFLVERYATLVRFLSLHDGAATSLRGRGAPAIGSVEYITRQAASFALSRTPRVPLPPATVPDEMVSVILVSYFDVNQDDVGRIQREHALSMGAENVVGELLERYIASVAEPRGWVWCSGSTVKAIDFIKPPTNANQHWQLLQVKNRDNSENSSSSAIRLGTQIEKWHRTFSRRIGSNWNAFPDEALGVELSEEGFKNFVRNHFAETRQLGLVP